MSSLVGSRWVSLGGLLAAFTAVFIIWTCSVLFQAIHDLFFHPLSCYPGPKLWIAFPITKSIAQIRGIFDFNICDAHEEYGHVVRIGPNELVFTTAAAWKDIYGHGHPELPKYFPTRSGVKSVRSIISADAQTHSRFRRTMLPAFSERAMEQQEPLIRKYVDSLVEKLRVVAQTGQPTDLVRWYTFTAFDLIGDLAYGKSFGGLAEGRTNKWVENIDRMMRFFPILVLASASPVISKVVMLMVPENLKKSRGEHFRLGTELAMERIRNKEQKHRGDFMDYMMRSQGEEHGLSNPELASNADTIIGAGSETTATLLCGVTYYLLRTPEALKRCLEEVRSAFDADRDIEFKAASKRLPYMLACLDEALRLFPPVPTVLMRRTLPGQMTVIDGHKIPENVSRHHCETITARHSLTVIQVLVGVHHLSTYHSSRNFHQSKAFCPERWLPEAQTNPTSPFFHDNRDAFKPFSTGPRNCIGRNLAYHEMRLILAKVLWNFDLGLTESCEGWAEKQRTFALWEKLPLMIRVRERSLEDAETNK